MKTFLLSLCIFITVVATAQSPTGKIDSLKYYQKQAWAIRKAYFDSMQANAALKDVTSNMNRLRSNSDSYTGFILYTTGSSADFKQFNQDNATSGYGPLPNNTYALGYGFTFKKNRRLFDLNVGAFGVDRNTKKDGQTIQASFSTFFEFVWGYDFIKSNRVNLYPFAGLGIRSSALKYKGLNTVNPTFTNISEIVQNNTSVNETASELGYQAGIGAEFVLTKPDVAGGILVFLKAGTNNPFKRKSFNFNGIKYDPAMKHGQFFITAGFKFFGR